jgi:glutaredoxin-related protein
VETEARSAPVVIFSSEFTDLRPILRRLDERQIAHREIIVDAAPTAPLDRYGDLRALTGWQTLPQVFVEGAFVGGYEEILRHPLIQQAAAPRSQTPAEVSGMAKALGYGGLAPFLLGAELLWWIPDRTSALWVGSLLSAYAAVILSFLGAVHWGRVVAREPGIENPRRLLALGVLPSLGGWGAMFSPVGTGPAAPGVPAGPRDAHGSQLVWRLGRSLVVSASAQAPDFGCRGAAAVGLARPDPGLKRSRVTRAPRRKRQ